MIMRPRHRGTIIISIGLAYIGLAYLGLMMLFSGCTKRIHTEPTGEEGATPIVTVREFPDVPIPKELKLDAKESFVYATPEFATGMQRLDNPGQPKIHSHFVLLSKGVPDLSTHYTGYAP